MLESVETGRRQTIDAVRKFVDQISRVVPEQPRRQTVVDAALDLAEELVTARIVRSKGDGRAFPLRNCPAIQANSLERSTPDAQLVRTRSGIP
ncbi:MAG: hypothetical protein WCB92_11635 [Mycobacterium sp.]